MLPPPPWLEPREFDRWIRVLEVALAAIAVLLTIGFGAWIFVIIPAMLR